jgi:hypothetical protein
VQSKRSLRWVLWGSLLASASGCLLVTPLDDLPPATSADGGAAGSAHGGKNQAGTTVLPEAGAAGDAPSTGGSSGGGAPINSLPCATNAECVKRASDEPAICRQEDHVCVPLKSNECQVVSGNASSPNAIVFGAFATINAAAPEENSIIWAHQLAIDELSGDNLGGLPGGPKKARRPLVMVVCDNSDSDKVDLAVTHLVDEIRVPAVVATLQPGDLRRAFEDHPNRDVFFISPVSVTETVAIEDDDDKIWALLGQPSDFTPTYAALLSLSEMYVRGLQTVDERTQPLRVALITTDDAFDSELAQAVKPTLRFNGKSPTDNGENFTIVTIGAKPNFTKLADDLAKWQPDIVVSAAGVPFLMTNGLQQRLEEDWAAYAGLKRPPFYILSPYDAGNLNDLVRRINGRLEREPTSNENERYVGVAIASAPDTSLQNAYALQLRSKHPNAVVDTANYYDAIYYLSYGIFAANQPTGLSGSGIAHGMSRLLAGDTLAVGPDGINEAFDALAGESSTLHVVSTLGPPDFDPKTGVRPVDGAVFCFNRPKTSSVLLPDVLRYDRAKQALVGKSFPCISGFYTP